VAQIAVRDFPPLVRELASRSVTRIIAFGSTSRFTKEASARPAERDVAQRLASSESDLAATCAQSSIAWTVLRPTLIYGAGRDRNVSAIARFVRRFGFFPLAGEGRGLRQPVHADDLARACLSALESPLTRNRAYNLIGGTTLSYRELVEAVFLSLGRRPRLVRVPLPLLRASLRVGSLLPGLRHLSPEMADRMDRDHRFDSEEARQDFGYAPRPFADPIDTGGPASA